MKPKWNWNWIHSCERKLRGYLTLEQYRWTKKLVRRIYREAIWRGVNIPTPDFGYSNLCFHSEYQKSLCIVLIFDRGDNHLHVIVDVISKDKYYMFGNGSLGCAYLSSTILHWDRCGGVPEIIGTWKEVVKQRRKHGWLGLFWTPFYWLRDDSILFIKLKLLSLSKRLRTARKQVEAN